MTEYSVKPRAPNTNAARPIVVVVDDQYIDEEGLIGSVSSLIVRLRHMPLITVVSATESVAFLKLVQDKWGQLPNFQFRVTPIEREIFTPSNPRRQVMNVTSVSFFGWREVKRGSMGSIGGAMRNRYHLLLDPMTFQGDWLEERSFAAHMEWARNLREFCIEQGWNLKPTQGATARQALQDPRFYPEARRKVPRATNDRVRENLPGNHYELGRHVKLEREYDADYFDQTRCHHYHAIQANLPDANSLYGYGRFRRGRAGRDSVHPYRYGRRVESFLNGFAGMVYGTLYWTPSKRDKDLFLPKCLRDYGTEKQPANVPVFWYTEDLPLFESLGVRPTSIIAAWGGFDRDMGIARYAEWALGELAKDAPLWKKRLLLAPYGALATRPRKQTVGYHESSQGVKRTLRSPSGIELEVSYHESSKEGEVPTNNVLHRALIEASNRAETLMFANELQAQGVNVLCIYVDAIIVESDLHNEIPLYPPWRLDTHLTRLQIISESQFKSAEVAKLPGLTGAQRREFLAAGQQGRKRMGDRPTQRIRAYEAWSEGRAPKIKF